ncbi:MAG: hypothetical protein SVZ03_06115 [Spirochaetota bacterium]|nr:hypothetical protein [Spirochaetota bacterium]
MKKYLLIIAVVFIILGCGSDDSDSDPVLGFIIKADTLTKYDSSMSYNISLDSTDYTGSYAVIYNGSIGNTSYVGIALSDDPSNEGFNMKIYFESSSIGESHSINDSNSTININDGGTTYTWGSGSLTLSISTEDNSTYTIGASGSATVNSGETLTITNITAVKVPYD